MTVPIPGEAATQKVIAIFGAGPGLGMAIAFRFGREGYRVALVGRIQSRLDSFVADLAAEGIEAGAFAADLIDTAAIPNLVAAILQHFGRIDAIVYGPTATDTGFTSATALTAEELRDRLALFLLTPIEIVQAVLPGMRERGDGAILATHGITAIKALPNLSGPGTVTAATRNYLHALRAELAGTGVFAGNLVVGGYIARGARYRGEDAETLKGVPTFADGSTIPVFDADDLADIYWEMVTRRDRCEVVPDAPGS